jgi:hypothetical protein
MARGMMGLMSPMMGTQAKGRAFFRPRTGVDHHVALLPNTWLHAEIEGAIRPYHLIRVLPNAATPDGSWPIEPAGNFVPIETIQGGARQNLADATVLRFTKATPPEGFGVDSATVYGPMSGGSDDTNFGYRVNWMGFYESFQVSQQGLDLFRAGVTDPPAVIVVWSGAEPADGITSSAVSRGLNRKGSGLLLDKEQFNIFVVVARADSDEARREEGLALIDEVRESLSDQRQYPIEGSHSIHITADDPIQFRQTFRINQNTGAFWERFYVYGVRVAATRLWTKRVARTAAPWKSSEITATGTGPNPNQPGETTPEVLVDKARVAMIQDGSG